MNDDGRTPVTIPARARRQAAGLVAQYIHELSERHADARHAGTADPGDRPGGSGPDEGTESPGS